MAKILVKIDDEQVSFDLQEGSNLIGRRPPVDIVISERSVSGKHATIFCRDDQWLIEDAGSRNGTLVNREKFEGSKVLAHNDMLHFGHCVAKFEDPQSASASSLGDVVNVTEDEVESHITAQLSSRSLLQGLEVNPEAKLRAVLEISNTVAGSMDVDSLLPKILDSLFGIFRFADRGCILLNDSATGEMVPRAMKHRGADEDATVRLSRTVVDRVLAEKVGLLSADASTDESLGNSESIAELKIRSMMCVPLLDRAGQTLGLVSIDTQNPVGQFKQEDLDILMTVAGQAALAFENARLVDAYAEKKKLDSEMGIARTIQRALLPVDMPQVDGYEFFASYDSAQAVGGDYYDWFDLGNGRICLSFGDVAGKGVPGAIIMGRMHSCVQSTIRHVREVVPAISAINDHMCETEVEGRFVTYLLAIIDTNTHSVELAGAGHMAPMIRRADGLVEQFDEDSFGTPIGILEDYPYESETRTLDPGDLVVMITDGVDEAMNPDGELYGKERCLAFVKNGPPSAEELGQSLLADVRRHAGGRPQNDDITIMAFGRNS